jgi:hypothetical protein
MAPFLRRFARNKVAKRQQPQSAALEQKKERVINENSKNVFEAASKKIKLYLLVFVILAIIVFSLSYFDRPQNTGKIIRGIVESTYPVQEGYRKLHFNVNASIRLDNGKLISKILPKAKVGDEIDFSIYERRITGFTTYQKPTMYLQHSSNK